MDDMTAEECFDDYFGVCPECHKTDGILNTGPAHWIFCKEHRVRWFVGRNVFDSWKHETKAEQRARYDELGFGNFEDITGREYHRPEPDEHAASNGTKPGFDITKLSFQAPLHDGPPEQHIRDLLAELDDCPALILDRLLYETAVWSAHQRAAQWQHLAQAIGRGSHTEAEAAFLSRQNSDLARAYQLVIEDMAQEMAGSGTGASAAGSFVHALATRQEAIDEEESHELMPF